LVQQPAASPPEEQPQEREASPQALPLAAGEQLSRPLLSLPCRRELFLRQLLPRRQCLSSACELFPQHLPGSSLNASSFR